MARQPDRTWARLNLELSLKIRCGHLVGVAAGLGANSRQEIRHNRRVTVCSMGITNFLRLRFKLLPNYERTRGYWEPPFSHVLSNLLKPSNSTAPAGRHIRETHQMLLHPLIGCF